MKLVPVLVSVFILASGSAHALNRSYVIQGNGQIGSYKLRVDPTLQGAIEVFGTPTRVKRGPRDGWNSCTARWAALGTSVVSGRCS